MLFHMAQLHKGLIFPNHFITSLGIRRILVSPAAEQARFTHSFPLLLCFILCRNKDQIGPQGSYYSLFPGLFVPAITGPDTQRQDQLEAFVSDSVPSGAFRTFYKNTGYYRKFPRATGKQECLSDSPREQCPPPPSPLPHHEPCFLPPTYT